MNHEIITFSLPKIGEAESTNQDRLARRDDGTVIAIADGAGSSLYPGQWAEILVQSFCRDAQDPIVTIRQSLVQWLAPLQEQWRKFYLEKLQAPSKQWWQGGSTTKSHGSATFVGLVLHPQTNSDASRWSAIAVGDSCLIQFSHASQTLVSFPIQTATGFKSTSACFASLPEYPSATPSFNEGHYESGDYFLLATDALSQWILSNYEAHGTEWQQLFELHSVQEFKDFISVQRRAQKLKNDDTSLVLVKIPGVKTEITIVQSHVSETAQALDTDEEAGSLEPP